MKTQTNNKTTQIPNATLFLSFLLEATTVTLTFKICILGCAAGDLCVFDITCMSAVSIPACRTEAAFFQVFQQKRERVNTCVMSFADLCCTMAQM